MASDHVINVWHTSDGTDSSLMTFVGPFQLEIFCDSMIERLLYSSIANGDGVLPPEGDGYGMG